MDSIDRLKGRLKEFDAVADADATQPRKHLTDLVRRLSSKTPRERLLWLMDTESYLATNMGKEGKTYDEAHDRAVRHMAGIVRAMNMAESDK